MSNPGKISYNGKDISLCCSNTRRGVPVTDKIPIPIIYVRAHGMTDSYVRTGIPSGDIRYLAYGTNVQESLHMDKGVIVSNLDSDTGNFKVLFGRRSDTLTAAPETLREVHHSYLTPISSEMFAIPDKTYILVHTDVGDVCRLDYKQSAHQNTIEDLLIADVLRPFMIKRKRESDELSDIEIANIRKNLFNFTGKERDRQLWRERVWGESRADGTLYDSNFRLLTPGSKILDTWLDFKNGCTHKQNLGGGVQKVNTCDITCINTSSMLTSYDTNRCIKYSTDMLTNKFHNDMKMISLRELIRNHGHGIYILSSCRSFAPGTDPREVEDGGGGDGSDVDTPALLARQVSEGRWGPYGNQPATTEGLHAAAEKAAAE